MLGCLVAVMAVAIVGGLGLMALRKQGDTEDADRMRRIYVALANYEMIYDGAHAPTLGHLEGFVDRGDLISNRDPYRDVAGSAFPQDGSLPDNAHLSGRRISFSYLGAYRGLFPRAEKAFLSDPRTGILADEWLGVVEPKGNFQAEVSGPVLRITIDGSVYRTTPRERKNLGDFEDLFFRH